MDELKELEKALIAYQTAYGCQYDIDDLYTVTAKPKTENGGRVLPCPKAD